LYFGIDIVDIAAGVITMTWGVDQSNPSLCNENCTFIIYTGLQVPCFSITLDCFDWLFSEAILLVVDSKVDLATVSWVNLSLYLIAIHLLIQLSKQLLLLMPCYLKTIPLIGSYQVSLFLCVLLGLLDQSFKAGASLWALDPNTNASVAAIINSTTELTSTVW
jgi:hypothetical protein